MESIFRTPYAGIVRIRYKGTDASIGTVSAGNTRRPCDGKAYITTFCGKVNRFFPEAQAGHLTERHTGGYNGRILQTKGRSAMLQCKNVGLT